MAAAGKSRLLPLLVLLAILAGAAGWNYRRNAAAEAAFRPFAGYADADLQVLLGAYEAEREERGRRFEAVAGRRTTARDVGLVGEQVREFERVQRFSEEQRSLRGAVAESEVTLEQIRAELARRERDRPAYKKYLRLIFTFTP